MLLLIKKHTDVLIEQTKTKPQETLKYKIYKQWETFSFSPPINLVEERKWLLAVTSYEENNTVFEITDENKSYSITTPERWIPEGLEDLINKVNEL